MNTKIIKYGKKYRKHKCHECKTLYAYEYFSDKYLVYCPVCHNYMDIHLFDKKITKKQYDEIKETK